MIRIKIEMPEKQLASVHVPVRISDVNYGNHVGNDAFVSIIHEARLQWLKQQGHSEINAGGTGMIMADLSVEFKNESFYGDIIEVLLCAGEVSRAGFELFYRLTVMRNEREVIIANAKTGMVCYNYDLKKPVSVPDALRRLLIGNY